MTHKWLAVIGSRQINQLIQADIERQVLVALDDGWSIVSGGSTGADHSAAKTVYSAGLAGSRLKLFLPLSLEAYCEGFRERVKRGSADADDTAAMIALLEKLRVEAPDSIADNSPFEVLDGRAFHYRNNQIVRLADRLLAFRFGESIGTNLTIKRARTNGVIVEVFDYDHID